MAKELFQRKEVFGEELLVWVTKWSVKVAKEQGNYYVNCAVA